MRDGAGGALAGGACARLRRDGTRATGGRVAAAGVHAGRACGYRRAGVCRRAAPAAATRLPGRASGVRLLGRLFGLLLGLGGLPAGLLTRRRLARSDAQAEQERTIELDAGRDGFVHS